MKVEFEDLSGQPEEKPVIGEKEQAQMLEMAMHKTAMKAAISKMNLDLKNQRVQAALMEIAVEAAREGGVNPVSVFRLCAAVYNGASIEDSIAKLSTDATKH